MKILSQTKKLITEEPDLSEINCWRSRLNPANCPGECEGRTNIDHTIDLNVAVVEFQDFLDDDQASPVPSASFGSSR